MAGKKKMGRPLKEIDKVQFEKLCNLQCTLLEIAGFFNCSDDTIERWCKRTYKTTFAECFKTFSHGGKISLRRTQFKLAERSAAMAIFLGKQYLGQTDKTEMDVNTQIQNPLEGISTEDIKKLIDKEG